MQQLEHAKWNLAGSIEAERKRVEAVVETLANLQSRGESVAEVAHDARNMVTALGLYCDLLEEPGVLATPFLHYGGELRLVAAASRRLVEKLVAIDARELADDVPGKGTVRDLASLTIRGTGGEPAQKQQRWELLPSLPIENLAAELTANRNLLAALAGPAIGLTVETEGGASPVRLTGEDLTRVLVNLVKNAAEAMPGGGAIELTLTGGAERAGVTLAIADNGPGIPVSSIESVFASGYTTRGRATADGPGWHGAHRGLGLSITRSIVEAAGGQISASNLPQGGARFEIELPVRGR